MTKPSGPPPEAGRTDDEELLRNFRTVGFTEYEARVYMQLLRASPATAYEIAKASGVPRPNTYNALDALAKRGAVMPISDNPRRFVAAPPEKHLSSIVHQTAMVCDDLADRLARLQDTDHDPYVWNVHGERAIHDKIDALIRDSRVSLRAKAAREVLAPHKAALADAAARGVEILVILFGEDPEEFMFGETCRVYLHENTGVRMGSADNLFTLTIDHHTALTATDDSRTAFYTRNHAIVMTADTLIRHDYYMARIHAVFGPEIEKAFGPHLRDLRLSSFSPEQARSFREKTGL